jgi:hypothetical protein
MSERSNGQFKMGGAAQISEPEFKRLCGQIWAESILELDGQEEPRHLYAKQECALLKALLVRLRHKLDQDTDGPEESFKFAEDPATLYRNEIERIMLQSSVAPFDYHRIINRLLREAVKEETI